MFLISNRKFSLSSRHFYTSLVMLYFNFNQIFRLVSGTRYCTDTMDCFPMPGHTCQNGRCICDPERDTGIFSCIPARIYGDKCRTDADCHTGDINIICDRVETKTCRCRRGLVWDIVSKRCYRIEDETYRHANHKFDPVRDLIVPGIIVMTVGAMMYLGIKLFCNCSVCPLRFESSRELEECVQQGTQPTVHPQPPATWVASYRVFSSMERSPSSQFGTSILHTTAPCLLVPGPTSMAPPPYEEALKHKIILSSYPTGSSNAIQPPPPHLPMVLPPLPPTTRLEPVVQDTPSSSSTENNNS